MSENPQQGLKVEDGGGGGGDNSTSAASASVMVSTGAGSGMCLKCEEKPITYECDPCHCPSFCTGCARKMATGGKCKVCGQFYGGVRRVRDD